MSLPIYETTLNILREAGFVLLVRNETADVDGAVITTAYPNIVSASTDTAEAATSDVVVTVNGTPATISSIDATMGKIVLSEAPTEGALVQVSYYYAPLPLEFVPHVRDDVECAILAKMRGVDPCAPYETEVPYCVRMITRLWTAGLLLAKDYGYNTDVENSSKDGYRKIEEAKSLLEEFYKNGGNCGQSSDGQSEIHGGAGEIVANSRGDLFGRHHCGPDCCHSDDCWERC